MIISSITPCLGLVSLKGQPNFGHNETLIACFSNSVSTFPYFWFKNEIFLSGFCHHLVFTLGLKENSGWTEYNDLCLKVSQKSMYFVWQSPHCQKLRNLRFIDRSFVYSKFLIELAFCTRELNSLLFCFLVSRTHFTSSPPASTVS